MRTASQAQVKRKQALELRGLEMLSVRLPVELLRRVGEYASRLRAESDGIDRPSVAKVIAKLLDLGLKEATRPRKGKAA